MVIKRDYKALALSFCLLLTGCGSPHAISETEESDRRAESGMFVFGPLLIDIHNKLWKFGPVARTANDCSNGNLFCLDAPTSFVLPKECDQNILENLPTYNGIEMTVMRKFQAAREPHEGAPDQTKSIWFLYDKDKKFAVYQYEFEKGITAILLDPTFQRDMTLVIQHSSLDELNLNPELLRIVTQEAFAACKN